MRKSEDGFTLPELLVAMPLLIITGLAILNVFAMAAKFHKDYLGDWELVQQVHYPMEEIAKDVRYCSEIRVDKKEDGTIDLLIKRHYLPANISNAVSNYWQTYTFWHLSDHYYYIYKNSQPVMGRTALTRVQLIACECDLLANNQVRVLIKGMNVATGHVFQLERVLYTYGYGMNLPGSGESSV